VSHSFDSIQDVTGFASGDLFESDVQVWGYFTVQNLREMGWSSEECPTQKELDEMAQAVIDNRWHMQKKYAVMVYYVDEDGVKHWLGRSELHADSEPDARKKALDDHWDDRLDAASCRPYMECEEMADGKES
jgi:hypothetical protein